jgi:signal transduction histidine kinase
MLKNCHRLADVVNSILDVTEIESGTLQLNLRPVNLSEMLDEVIGVHAEGAANKRLSWNCRFELDPPEIRADPRRLRQVLSELVSNAIKFSNPGGRISIQAALRTPWVEIEIVNMGARIDPALRKMIFEKFCQGSQANTRSVGGCGLGLFLVQNLVRLHGGEVQLLELAGDETTFLVRLPSAPAGAAQPEAVAGERPAAR